jgi:hypothetical protein
MFLIPIYILYEINMISQNIRSLKLFTVLIICQNTGWFMIQEVRY